MAFYLISNDKSIAYRHLGVTAVPIESVSPIPANHGVSWANGNMLSCSSSSKVVTEYDGFSASPLQSIVFTNNPIGVTWDGSNLITVDAGADTANQFVGLSNTPLASFSAATVNPYGCEWYEGNLYVISIFGELDVYDGFSSSVLNHVASLGESSFTPGVAVTPDGNLLVSSNLKKKIHQYVGVSNTLDFEVVTTFAPYGIAVVPFPFVTEVYVI